MTKLAAETVKYIIIINRTIRTTARIRYPLNVTDRVQETCLFMVFIEQFHGDSTSRRFIVKRVPECSCGLKSVEEIQEGTRDREQRVI